MVIPCLSLIPLIIVAAVVFAIADVRRVQTLALAVTLALLASYLVYAVAQSYVVRASPPGRDWLTAAVRHVYSLDRPYNDFPRMHTPLKFIVAVSWLMIHLRPGMPVTDPAHPDRRLDGPDPPALPGRCRRTCWPSHGPPRDSQRPHPRFGPPQSGRRATPCCGWMSPNVKIPPAA